MLTKEYTHITCSKSTATVSYNMIKIHNRCRIDFMQAHYINVLVKLGIGLKLGLVIIWVFTSAMIAR